MNVALIQPAYPYGKPQIYLPGGLLNFAARLIQVGITVSVTDLNLEKLTDDTVQSRLKAAHLIGITVLGPPYIPSVIRIIEELRARGYNQPVVIGGQGVIRLADTDFQAWFGHLERVFQDRNNGAIEERLGILLGGLPSEYDTSMVPALRQLSDKQVKAYLTREFCFFVSQGCAQECHFCAAAKNQKEKYRSFDAMEDELRFICSYLQSIGHKVFRIYVSNLDTFQTPDKIDATLGLIGCITREYGVEPHVRGLATAAYTAKACKRDPELAQRLRANGLRIVAFGADGGDKDTWEEQGKTHNTKESLDYAVRAMQHAGITPELLMVIGFTTDKPKAYWANLSYSLRMAARGAQIRPYLAKTYVPSGNWPEGNASVDAFRRDSSLLIRLDYAITGSPETHPNQWQRYASNAVYLAIIGLLKPVNRCPNNPLFAPPETGVGRWAIETLNRLMPFDR